MRAIRSCLVIAVAVLAARCHFDDRLTAPGEDSLQRQALKLPEVTIACTTSIVADLKVANDLFCDGNGPSVDADGVTVDLNGHTVSGSGAGVGITVRGRQNVTVVGGTVRGFLTGILVANSTGILVKGNRFTDNREGIFLNGSSNSLVIENEAWQNQLRGIMLRPTLSGVISTGNLVKENVLWENPSGVLVFGQPGNTFRENRISQSSFAAFDLTGGGASANVFKENVLESSAVGFSFGAGWTGNTLVENRLIANTCAIQGTTAGNSLSENQLTGNGVDFC